MPLIDRETVQRITDTADIVEVVSDYVHLIRRGANYVGLCPFHNERTPSFSVNKSKNFCFCFSCKQGGSPVNFIMKKEGLSYHEALLHLARKYGIEVKERELTQEERRQQSEREAMLVANEWAMKKMSKALYETEEGREIGLSYFYGQRGITQEAARAFNLGYSPDRGNWLVEEAKITGFDIDVLKKTGLVGTSQDGRNYDKYRGRVIFPIQNTSGKVIGFGGRTLKNDKAKYINSPESEIYKKSNELYGLFQAKGTIGKEDKCYLVEGYFDVIGMWQSGLKNVVASSGTALTDGQIALIHRFTDKITLIYDGDAAGIKAALRGVDMLLHHKMQVKVLLLPDGHDPDSFARSVTPSEFKEFVGRNEMDVIRFKAQVLMKDIQSDPQQRISATTDMITTLAHIEDHIARDIYIQECSLIMNLPEESILKAVVKKRRELVEQWKRARIYKDIDRTFPSPQRTVTSESLSESKPSGSPLVSGSRSTPVTGTDIPLVPDSGNSRQAYQTNATLKPFETKLIEYALKFGYMPFCEYSDEETGEKHSLNVLQFMEEELREDNLDFTTPLYKHVFQLLKNLESEFETALEKTMMEIRSEIEMDRRKGIEEIAEKGMSVSEITKSEKKLEETLKIKAEQRLSDFQRYFPSRVLASHEEDDVRELVNQLIIERHQLSNIYYRDSNKVERDEDRLQTLMLRALTELKGEILNIELRNLYAELNEQSHNHSEEVEAEILKKINRKIHQRSIIAKTLGERIISPK